MVHDGIVYKIFANQATIFALDDRNLKDIVIPEYVLGRPVTEIADNAFANTLIRKIRFPSSVVLIGRGAFHNCSNLIGVYQYRNENVKDNVFVKDYAFFNCRRLETLLLNPYLIFDGDTIFKNCENLVSFGISKIRSQSRILPASLSGCVKLKEITFWGNNKVQIPDLFFLTCHNLKKIYFFCNVEITDYLKEKFKELEIYCNSTSNVLNLAYEGYNVINVEVEK